MSKAQRDKATGIGDIFARSLATNGNRTSIVMPALWSAFGLLKYMIADCTSTLLVTIYEKGRKQTKTHSVYNADVL